jgi:hypothetical protein
MATLTELIRDNAQRPIRRCYIKRRDTAGNFETDWFRIDTIDGMPMIKTWGTASIEIDFEQGRLGKFNISTLSMSFRNDNGFFNKETDERSLWYGWLVRKYTKLKIDTGYLDESGNEIGVATIFEGVIDYIKTSDAQDAQIRVLPYTSVLKSYDISDLGLTGKKSINTIIDLIMNQAKIIKFIPFVASAADENVDITDTSLLTGDYWKVITDLAFKSSSIPLLVGSVWSFVPRSAGAVSQFDFEGRGYGVNSDIISIDSFDDGDTKVKVRWLVTGTNLEAISSDPLLLLKYLGEPETVTLDDVDTTPQKQGIINQLLANWQYPKRLITFKTKFLVNTVKPLDKITLRMKGQYTPSNTMIWGSDLWGDGSVWGLRIGSIILDSAVNFMVIKVEKNVSDWSNTITAEEIL